MNENEWDAEFWARKRKAERTRGRTPLMLFDAPAIAKAPATGEPAWFPGGWHGCTCSAVHIINPDNHRLDCPVFMKYDTKPVVSGNIALGMPYGKSSTPQITPDPYAEFAEFAKDYVKWKTVFIAGMASSEWQGCTCADPDAHASDCPVFKKHVPMP